MFQAKKDFDLIGELERSPIRSKNVYFANVYLREGNSWMCLVY